MTEVFTIPIVTLDGRGWDEAVEAEDAKSALNQLELEKGEMIATPWMEEHFGDVLDTETPN